MKLNQKKSKIKKHLGSNGSTSVSLIANKNTDDERKSLSKSKIQKRNTRMNSLCYNNTEMGHIEDKKNNLKKNIHQNYLKNSTSFKNISVKGTNQSWGNLSFTKMSTKKNIQKIPIDTTNTQHSILFTSSNFQTNNQNSVKSSCEINSENSNSSSNEIRIKIQAIYNDIYNLLNRNSDNDFNKVTIVNEIGKIYRNLKNKILITNGQNNIDEIFEENEKIKKKNQELLDKVNTLEKKINAVMEDNVKLKEQMKINSNTVELMQNKLLYFKKEFESLKSMSLVSSVKKQKLQNGLKENTEKSNNNLDDSGSFDNISLGNNLNITNANTIEKHKKDNKIFGKEGKLNLNFKKVSDFNSEFLGNYDEFSPSWRRDVDKMLSRKQN